MPIKKFRKAAALLILFSVILVFYPEQGAAASPGVLIIKLKNSNSISQLHFYSQDIEPLFDDVYRLKVADKDRTLRELRAAPFVEFVEAEVRVETETNAADPLFVLDTRELSKQWYLAKMKVHEAWEITQGSGITVAIVDTGIDGRHEDLNDGRVIKGYASYCQVQSSVAQNECLIRISGELSSGVNSDDNGHGTIVAGIIGAISNNNKGIAGINWNVKLMPIKALDAKGSGLASDVAVGIRWAVDSGARIINLSIGGSDLKGIEVLEEAIGYAFNKGVLVVAAAGNDASVSGGNLNINPVLPACADGGQNMVVGVAAVDVDDHKARFSNYGSNCVDIAAPGTGTFIDKQNKQGLVSTYYDPTKPGENDLYVFAVGTSMAAPMVSGAAALMVSAFPDLDVRAVRDRLIGSVDNIDDANLAGCNGSSCVGQIGKGRLNVLKAVQTVTTFAAGTLVRSPDGQVFLIERGLKRPITDYVFRQRFFGLSIIQAAIGQLDSFPIGEPVPPVDGTLIKEPADPTVYILEDGQRRTLSYLAFISRSLKFEQVVTLSAADLASYPAGRDAEVLDGVLLKAPDHPAVYILNKGTRQLLSFFVFRERGLDSKPIAILSLEELASYPVQEQGFLYPPLEETMIRGDAQATVYLIEQGKRHGLTLMAFERRGFRFVDVKIVPQSEVEGYEFGEPILE